MIDFDRWPFFFALIGIFFGGVALNLTPCVYPLIPVTISVFAAGGARGKRTTAVMAGLYVFGLVITNSFLGLAASLTGGLMGELLQNSLVLVGVSAVLLIFAASLFGVWELALPSRVASLASAPVKGYAGTLFMGITMGLVAAPCIGPFVLGLLTWVAAKGSPAFGFTVFFFLSLGLGLPLFFLSLFSGKISRMPKSGPWMVWVRNLFGWVLAGMAIYYLRPVLPGNIGDIIFATTIFAGGIHLGWIEKSADSGRIMRITKTLLGIVAIIGATAMAGSSIFTGPSVFWHSYSDKLVEKAIQGGRGVIIDFSADWCSPCRRLERVTFHDPEIVSYSRKDILFIKVDLTKKDDPLSRRLVLKYGVKGVPTIVFIDPKGRERKDLRITEYMGPKPFLKRIAGMMVRDE